MNSERHFSEKSRDLFALFPRPPPYNYPSEDPIEVSTYTANFRESNFPRQGLHPTSPRRKNNPHPKTMTNAFNYPNRVSVSQISLFPELVSIARCSQRWAMTATVFWVIKLRNPCFYIISARSIRKDFLSSTLLSLDMKPSEPEYNVHVLIFSLEPS